MLSCIGALALVGTVAAAGASVTTVSGQRSGDVDTVTEDSSALDVDGFFLRIPGAAVRRDGGPLAPVRPLLRGLGGSRLQASVLGLAQGGLVAGDLDLALLPLALGRSRVDVGAGDAFGGSLDLMPARDTFLSLHVGSLNTLQAQGRAHLTTETGHVTVAADGGTSSGDFSFVADNARGDLGPVLTRANNDQQRFNLAVVGEERLAAPDPLPGQLHLDALAVVGLHRGGIAGLATAPLLLRQSTERLGAQSRLRWRLADLESTTTVAGRFDNTSITDPADTEARGLSALGGELRQGLTSQFLRSETFRGRGNVAIGLGTIAAVVDDGSVGSAALHFQRLQRDASAKLQLAWSLDHQHTLAVDTRGAVANVVDARSDGSPRADDLDFAAFLPSGGLRIHLQRKSAPTLNTQHNGTNAIDAFVGVTHASRAPTLDERFAPRGLVVGNPKLAPEQVNEMEVGVAVHPRSNIDVSAVAHASRLDDAIVYVNANAFEIRPENTGAADRVGLDLGATIRPWPLLSLDVVANLLHSAVVATGSPLPGAPPFALLTSAVIGDAFTHVGITVTSRGAAPSTLFGTLPSPATTLVALTGTVAIDEHLALTARVDNAFDVQTARDTNLIPLPGRLLFVGLEVRP